MSNNIQRALRLFTAAMVLAGYWALGTTEEYSMAVMLIPFCILPFVPMGEYLDRKYRWYRQLTTHLTVACLAFTVIYLFAMMMNLAPFDLLASVTMLVMYIQAYELMHAKEERNYYHVFLMAFFMLVAASVGTPDAGISLALILFMVSAVGAFVLLQTYSEARKPKHQSPASVVPLAQAARGVFKPVRTLAQSGLTLSIAGVTLLMLALTAVFFYITPRTEAGILGRSDASPFATTGLSEHVDLLGAGQITRDASPIMWVEFPEEPDGMYNGPLIWRVASLSDYTGSGWSQREAPPRWRDNPAQAEYRRTRHDLYRTRVRDPHAALVHQRVYLDSLPTDGIPGLSMIVAISTPSATLSWSSTQDYSVVVSGSRPRNLQYEVWSETGEPGPADLQQAGGESPEEYIEFMGEEEYEHYTRHDLQQRTIDLVEQITADSETAYQKAVAIENYFGAGFLYSLDLPPLPEDSPVDTFIHETQIGHCELYASAMALMLRAAGVPTRVVTGYRGGIWNESDAAYVVRADMAHLWLEVLFPEEGWVTFDPSPSDTWDNETFMGDIARFFSTMYLRSKMFWYSDVVGYDPVVRFENIHEYTAGVIGAVPGWLDSEGGSMFGRLNRDGIPTAPAILALIGFFGVSTWFALQWRDLQFFGRRPKGRLTPDQIRAIRLYNKVFRRLRHCGADVDGRTAGEILEEARRSGVAPYEPAREALAVYDEVRFGGRALPLGRYRDLCRRIRAIRGNGRASGGVAAGA